MMITMKEEEEKKKMLFNGNNAVMNKYYPGLFFGSEYVTC